MTKKLQPLGANQRAALARSSQAAIETGLTALRRFLSRGRWISLDNRYRRNSLEVLKADVKASTVNDKHLVQYIAASASLHCADGWSFLGRALQCHARGIATSAVHLAYYAELRAANALLATQGIGIFDKPSFSVTALGTCQKISGYGTHDLAWLALDNWADRPVAADLLADIISAEGTSLRTWLDNFQKSSPLNRSHIAAKWLRMWGLDLQRFVGDREARNEASYRPSRITPAAESNVLECARFLCDVWTLHEPSGSSRFDAIDRFLLRRSLEETYRVVKGRSAGADPIGFRNDVDLMVANLGLAASAATAWTDFFIRNVEPTDPAVINMAMNRAKDTYSHMRVISRAVILLRVATGACAKLLESTEFGLNELRFWWERFGLDRGLWSATTAPDSLTDLWADVANAIGQIGTWAEANKNTASYSTWHAECPNDISVLGTCERIALWGLGL